jgi:hypothetical protein
VVRRRPQRDAVKEVRGSIAGAADGGLVVDPEEEVLGATAGERDDLDLRDRVRPAIPLSQVETQPAALLNELALLPGNVSAHQQR